MKRSIISPRASRKRWNRAIASVHPLNSRRTMRGGVRF